MSFQYAFLRFLSGQKPLARLLPGYAELRIDPAASLDRRTLRIRPLRPVRLALFLFLATPILPFALNLDPLLGEVHWTVDVLLFAIWPAIGLLFLLAPSRAELILGRREAIFRNGRRRVVCPWELFNVKGNAFGRDPPDFLVAVPVDPNAAHRVVLMQDDAIIAHGPDVRTREFRFQSPQEIHLTGRYQASPTEIGNLLLELGRRLGEGDVGREAAPTEPAFLDKVPAPVLLDDHGWAALPLLNLSLPPVCCVCGAVSESCVGVEVARRDWPGRLVHVFLRETSVTVPVPVCAACQARRRRRLWGARLLGVLAGLLVVACFVVQILVPRFRLLPFELLVMLVAIGGAIFPIVGFLAGSSIGDKPPVEAGYVDERRGFVVLRFRRPEILRSLAQSQLDSVTTPS